MAYSHKEFTRGYIGLSTLKEHFINKLQNGFKLESIDHCRLHGNTDYMTSTDFNWEGDPIGWSIISESGNGDNILGILRGYYLDTFGYDEGEAAFRVIAINRSNVTRVKDVKQHASDRDGKECFTIN